MSYVLTFVISAACGYAAYAMLPNTLGAAGWLVAGTMWLLFMMLYDEWRLLRRIRAEDVMLLQTRINEQRDQIEKLTEHFKHRMLSEGDEFAIAEMRRLLNDVGE